MAKPSLLPAWQRDLAMLAGTVLAVVVVGCLYWAQTIFIPLALAIFLSFLLSPVVTALQRRRLGRVPSVILVVLLTGGVVSGVGWVVMRQVVSLVDELPEYTDNIRGKIKSLRTMVKGEGTGRLGQMIDAITNELQLTTPPGPGSLERPAPSGQPQAVIVQPQSPAWLARLPAALGSAADMLGGFALAIVLVVFMLLNREDLRNRLIRLVGHGQIMLTTKAVDEAGQRISRFLLMQAIVNGTYGLALALGLFLIGVEHALLWGFLAAVLRYIPYIGAWIAAIPTVLLSLAMFEGWLQPALVIGLILVIELISNNVMEPRLYGQSMGVSEVALLVSAAFWAFLWGPIGMVLSSPMTVCLVVLGKYVPRLKFLDVLLGDEPALDAKVSFYQRLLARDQDEATQLVFDRLKTDSPQAIYDELLVPALIFARRDRERGDFAEGDERFVCQALREILEDLGEHWATTKPSAAEPGAVEGATVLPRVRMLGCPARDELDRLGLEMLQQLLDPAKCDMEITAVETLTSELVAQVADEKPVLICIGSLPPGGLAHTRYLCKRLRARIPGAKIVVGRWGLKSNVAASEQQLREAGADEMETTLLDTRDHLNAWLPVLAVQEAKAAQENGGRPVQLPKEKLLVQH